MTDLIRRLARDHRLTTAEYEALLRHRTPELRRELTALADRTRRDRFGTRVHVRGVVELSSICRNDCLYCVQRRSNRECMRYRLRPREILECFEEGYGLDHRNFVFRGGEDGFYSDDLLEPLIGRLKSGFPGCAVTLALGERSRESYARLYNAGADRYCMRHEAADRGLYEMVHPLDMSYDNRMHCLNVVREIGYQVGCGFIVGLPGQTPGHLARDLKYIEEFQPHMVDIGPFVPQPGTPFAGEPAGDGTLVNDLISLIRLICPGAMIVSSGDLEGAILAGANVADQTLYPADGDAEILAALRQRMADIGFEVTTEPGDLEA